MKKEYLAPGVYIEETSLLPKSVAAVETAIPAFIGFTQKAAFNGQNFHWINKIQPLEVNSWTDFEKIFGGLSRPASVEIELNDNNAVKDLRIFDTGFLYHSVRLFFENGGSTCLIVSVGDYTAAKGKEALQLLLKGVSSLEKNNTPTLLVVPDAANLSGEGAGEVHAAMLAQCSKLKNRFAILDMAAGHTTLQSPDNPVERFRNHLVMNSLSYGAVYYPWLIIPSFYKADPEVIKNCIYFRKGVRIEDLATVFNSETLDGLNHSGNLERKRLPDFLPGVRPLKSQDKIETFAKALYAYFKEFYCLQFNGYPGSTENAASAIHAGYISRASDFHRLLRRFYLLSLAHNLQLAPNDFAVDFHRLKVLMSFRSNGSGHKPGTKSASALLKSLASGIEKVVMRFYAELDQLQNELLDNLKQKDEALKNIADAIESRNILVPPGGAIAGVITRVDRERGVWKAPANVSLTAVAGPAVVLRQEEQEALNVDVVAGKSVNAIRSFAGKGTLVWGARTLAGNDNEWRYISVRRLAIMIEQSVLEATSQFVFEPNEAGTWVKVKAVIENFLVTLWRQGAFQGAKPEEAFFVKVGLNQTMTAQDLQNGLMITEIGFAAVSPAEFLILRIVHKMQNN